MRLLHPVDECPSFAYRPFNYNKNRRGAHVDKRLPQYSGPLTAEQIASGMNAATRNASRLSSDALTMLQAGSFASACALAILSIEESGKHTILRQLALAKDQEDVKLAWREYRKHTSKNQHWLLIDSFLHGASKLRDFGHLFDPDADHPYVLDQLKQVTIYTDCLDVARWSVPDEIIDEPLARMLVGVSHVLAQSHEITIEEIELWITYLQPTYHVSAEAMERAVIDWDKEMRRRGLISGGTTMEEFVTRGISPPHRRGGT